MKPDFKQLFYQMVRIRRFEEAIARLWYRGLISGEMHLGVGEEAIVAGVVGLLTEDDALALDHRSTPPLVARGVDLRSLMLELLGCEDGLCRGRGGHMHLLAPEHLAASSGIVGASGPLACGFALAAEHLRPGGVAVSFFGEGAMNQGMLMEALNLAAVWRLPAIFVCKDSGFAITTRSQTVTGGSLLRRAQSLGLPACYVNGARVESVWKGASKAVERARQSGGPTFILARCHRPEGHFLEDPLLRVLRQPLKQAKEIGGPLARASLRSPGAPWGARLAGLAGLGATLLRIAVAQGTPHRDPVAAARQLLPREVARKVEDQANAEVEEAVATALKSVAEGNRG